MSDEPKDNKKKDLTGIFELTQKEPSPSEQKDPFAMDLPPVEQVDSFDSIDQLGMVDHPQEPEESAPPLEETQASDTRADADLFPVSEPAPEANPPADSTSFLDTSFEAPSDPTLPANDSFTTDFPTSEPTIPLEPTLPEQTIGEFDASPPMDYLENLKSYSEKSRETAFDPGTRYPFHLLIQGSFDPYSRDKLLLFITENPIGTNSSELDLQIQGGRVLLPRISEFAGVKLIQDLRDSGLSFRLTPSPVDPDEVMPEAPSAEVHYSNTQETTASGKNIPILPKEQYDQKIYEVLDTIQMVQFLKAEMLEVEKSDLFQELLTRMTAAIKRKATAMGANALTNVHHKVDPMRLPSQYKLELNATLLKKV